METIQKKSKRGGARPGAGRPKGKTDEGCKLIREMVVDAVNGVGGIAYFQRVAESHPAAFLSLVGKVLPVQVTGEDGGAVKHSIRVTFG